MLVIPTFQTGSTEDLLTSETTDFTHISRELIHIATATVKSSILIHMSSNGGGNIITGFNLFRDFFPSQDIYSATRFRSHDAVDLMGKIFAQIKPDALSEYSAVHSSGLDYRSLVVLDHDRHFVSWEELYGFHEILGMNSSSLFTRFSPSSSFAPESPVYEAGARKQKARSICPFVAENIVILSEITSTISQSWGFHTIEYISQLASRLVRQ